MQEHIPEKNIRSGPPRINHSLITNYIANQAIFTLFFSYLFPFVMLVTYCTQITTPLRGVKQWR